MSYVEDNLMPEETIVYEAYIHWFVFVPSVVSIALGVWLLSLSGVGPLLGVIAIVNALLSLSKAMIRKSTTELVITSKRVIAKFGLISRKTVELNHSKVESFNIDQSIFGRIFDYGTLTLNGTGGGETSIPSIVSPLDFRREAMQVIDKSR